MVVITLVVLLFTHILQTFLLVWLMDVKKISTNWARLGKVARPYYSALTPTCRSLLPNGDDPLQLVRIPALRILRQQRLRGLDSRG